MALPELRTVLRGLVAVVLAPTLALGGVLVAPSAQAQTIKPTFWGMHDTDWTTPPRVPVGAANFTTSGTYWRSLQPVAGEPNWAKLDAQVDAARANGAEPMIVLGHSPRFAVARRHRDKADYYSYTPSTKLWRRYVTRVADRYGSRLDYQIWPEPNIIQNWKAGPHTMARLTMVASRAIKRQAPRATVVSPAVALRLKAQRRWTQRYFKQTVGGSRVHRYLDVVAIDPFPDQKGTPEDSYEIMRSARKDLRGIGVRKPIWTNEINYGVAGGGSATGTRYPVAKQQSYVVRTYVLSAAARMKRTYWLGWFRTDTMAVKLARDNGERLRPARSYDAVHAWLSGTRFRGCSQRSNGVWVCTARESSRDVRRIYWKPHGKAVRITTPRSTRQVQNQAGRQIAGRGSRGMDVTFRPIMVQSRR